MEWEINVYPQAYSPCPFYAVATRLDGKVLVGVTVEGRTAEEAAMKLKERLSRLN